MTSWSSIINDINKATSTVGKDVGRGIKAGVGDVSSAVNQLPGAGEINKIGQALFGGQANQNVLNAPSSVFNDIQKAISPGGGVSNWVGSQFPFNQLGGSSSSSKKKTSDPPATTTTGGGQATTPQLPDALTAGLGMFFSQYLAPMMGQISAQNNTMISDWGNAMNQALAQPLPAGVKAVMQPWVGANQQMLGMINQAGAQQAASTIPFTQFLNTVGNQTTAMQAMTEAFTKAATEQELGISNPTALQTAISQAGGLPQGLGALVQMLGNTSSLPGVPGITGSGTPTSTNTGKANTNPVVVPTTTPSTTPTTQASSVNAALANQIAASLLGNQMNTANAANQAASAGYTTPYGG